MVLHQGLRGDHSICRCKGKSRREGVQEAVKSKKDPEPRAVGGTRWPLKAEKPRVEGTGSYKEQEKPRGKGGRGYKPAIEVRKTQRGGCRSV